MTKIKNISTLCCILAFLSGCGSSASEKHPLAQDPAPLTWEEKTTQAKGSTVQMMMWQGDPFINAYMSDYVVPKVKEELGITLNISSGQGPQVVSSILAEQQANVATSDIDMMWINGETFFPVEADGCPSRSVHQ